MPWPFFLPNALPGDKLKKNGVTGKLILTVGGKLTKDPFCCCDPYVTPHCPECPTCDPEATWIGTATDDGGLAEIAGGGPWGMLNAFDDPALPCGDAPFSISGYTRTDEFEYCGVTLRVTIIGDVVRAIRIKGRVQIDEINRLGGDVLTQDR